MKRAKRKAVKRSKPRRQPSYNMGQGSKDMMKLVGTAITAGAAIGITGMAIKAFKP